MKTLSYTNKPGPREKLIERGAESLTDHALLSILLGSGSSTKPVSQLAKDLLKQVDSRGECLSYEDLIAVSGIGSAQACRFLATREFFKRRNRVHGLRLTSPQKVLPFLLHLAKKRQEHVISIHLNGSAEVLSTKIVTIGTLDRTPIHPREVFAEAITERAAGIILAHNHPSGDTTPSLADRVITRKLKKAGRILGIPLIDHIIFSSQGYFSFKEEKLI